jgi:hypothetical protein
LLFLVVFYAYPMKFIFTRLITGTLMGMGPRVNEGMSAANGRMLMAVYSGGFVALFAVFMLLHWNALRQRQRLGLGTMEVYDARASVRRHSISVALGLISFAIAVLFPPAYLAYSGLIFFLMGPAHGVFGYMNGRNRERLEASLRASSVTS